MEYKDIVAEIRKKLGDSPEENDKLLKRMGEDFARAGDLDSLRAVGELLLENMPEERRNEIHRLTHIDGMRLDEIYKKIVGLINEKKPLEAIPLAERLYKKITLEYAENETEKFVSLRNPFEDNLCQVLFKQDKKLNRTPFDFATYLTTYAYLLIETGANIDAIPVLERAIEYNPVDVGPKFELTEVYKIIRNKKMVIETTRQALAVASSPVAIARCYENIGYTLTDFGEYDDAFVFYIASTMFAANPAVQLEINHVTNLKGTPAVMPSREKIISTLKKYDIEFGPNQKVIETTAQLATYYLGRKNIPDAVMALKIMYSLTMDEEIKNLIIRLDPKSARPAPSDSKAESNRANITKTDNPNPES
ncbi:MAG: tetratricopeptide repeat protein [Ruminococcus flavefaciens]|nr:tetratricopeptide repeat protein [Ruminococcus flavefaciens]MCM1228819.1 tetratricopeptide repeat protein [Ruminococcus flavefaciens]